MYNHSDVLFDSYDEEVSDVDIKQKLAECNLEELRCLIEEVLINECIEDATLLCFQVFKNIAINSKAFYKEHSILLTLSENVLYLKLANKVKTQIFTNYVKRDFIELSLDAVWWLQNSNIICMAGLLSTLQRSNIPLELSKILKSSDENNLSATNRIIEDVLVCLIAGYYGRYVNNTPVRQLWSDYCRECIAELINYIFEDLTTKNEMGFANILPLIQNIGKYFSGTTMKVIFKNLLIKLMEHNVSEYNMYHAYMYQELWSSKHLLRELRVANEEIFREYCNIWDIWDVIDTNDYKINWKYTLAALGVCMSKSSNGITEINRMVLDSIKVGNILLFHKGLLFMRQVCLEDIHSSYKEWLAETFGTEDNVARSFHPPIFNRLIAAFTRLIPYEPKAYLEIHIDDTLYVPPTSQSIMYDYKQTCSARLMELSNFGSVFMMGCEIVILHLIEESFKVKKISSVLIEIITSQPNYFYTTIVPQIVKENSTFKAVKQMLIDGNFWNEDQIGIANFCAADFFDETFAL